MSSDRTVSVVLGTLLVVANLYWWRRERTVRESLAVSRDWEADGSGDDRQKGELAAARTAADVLDTRPEALPDRVEAVDEERRELRRETDRLRERWARTWWEARSGDPVSTDESRVVTVDLPHGGMEDVKAFAKRALEDDHAIALVTARENGAFAVAIGAALREEFDASEIATGLAGDGGAGGSEHLAMGGNDDGVPEETVERVRDRIEAAIEDR